MASSGKPQQQYFYKTDGIENGPVNGTALKTLADCGKLKPSDFVRKAESKNWHSAAKVKGLFNRGVDISLRRITYTVNEKGLFGKRNPKTLLKEIDIDIKRGEFIGIIGPSGSGKSTLIRVLNGDYKPADGIVQFNGTDADEFLSSMSHKMAYLPQELILHETLTTRQALISAAKLRNIENPCEMVDKVLRQTGMVERADVEIKKLSGGQKKRAALASELLNKPEVLFLDEATSGLDPASEKEMMGLFRSLADEGITVICITHFPDNLALCDKLIVVNSGWFGSGYLAYFGKPQDTLDYFGIKSMGELYSALQSIKPEDRKPFPQQLPALHPTTSETAQKDSVTFWQEIRSCPQQLPVLTGRYARILVGDVKRVLLLFLIAPCIAVLIGLTCKISTKNDFEHAADWKRAAFMLVLSVILCSNMNGIWEVVKEHAVFQHERRYRLNTASYLFSKLILLGIIGIVQSCVMLEIVRRMTDFGTDYIAGFGTLILLTIYSTSLGLLISSIVKTSEQAATILPIIVIALAVFSGGIVHLEKLNLVIGQMTAASYWGLEGLKNALKSDLLETEILGKPQPIAKVFMMILMMTVFLIGSTMCVLNNVKINIRGILRKLMDVRFEDKQISYHWQNAGFLVIGGTVFTFSSFRLYALREKFPKLLSQAVNFIPNEWNEPAAAILLLIIWLMLITAMLTIALVITGKKFHLSSFFYMFWWSAIFLAVIALLLFCDTVLNGKTALSKFVSNVPMQNIIQYVIVQGLYWITAYAMLGIVYRNCQNGIERDSPNRIFPPVMLTVCAAVLLLLFEKQETCKFAGYLPDALCLAAIFACIGLITKQRHWLLLPFCSLIIGIMNLTATVGYSELLLVSITLFIAGFFVIEDKKLLPLLLTAVLSVAIVILCSHLRSYNSPEILTLLAVWCAVCLWRMLTPLSAEETAPPPSAVFYFYLNGGRYGPVTREQLKQYATANKITRETVIESAAGQRAKAGAITWLSPYLPSVPVPNTVPVPKIIIPKQR
jgi:ABC-type multidrug transport system ATPase subunit